MEISALLRQLADEHIDSSWNRPDEFHRVGDLTVVSNVVFSSPEPPEWSECEGVPAGRHPVHIGVVRRRDHETGDESTHVSMVFIPLAAPEVIAGATFEDVIEDWQPLGPDFGFLWDSTAMDVFRPDGTPPQGFEDLDALVAHVASELEPADVLWADVVVDAETGANVLAFQVNDESAMGFEGRDADGNLVGVLFTGAM